MFHHLILFTAVFLFTGLNPVSRSGRLCCVTYVCLLFLIVFRFVKNTKQIKVGKCSSDCGSNVGASTVCKSVFRHTGLHAARVSSGEVLLPAGSRGLIAARSVPSRCDGACQGAARGRGAFPFRRTSNGRSGDDRRVDDVAPVSVRWSPAGSLPPALTAQRGVVDRLLRRGRTLRRLAPCGQTGVFRFLS